MPLPPRRHRVAHQNVDARRVLVLAHRGLVAPYRPENTAGAVAAALAAGADGVEVDVRLTADGVVVACHDDDLGRVAGRPVPVASSPWSDLRRVRLPGGGRLATLAELLDVAGGARVVVEVKPPPAPAGPPLRTALAVLGVLRSHGRRGAGDIVVSSSSPAVLEALGSAGARGSRLRTAVVGRPPVPLAALVPLARRLGCAEVHPHVDQALRAAHLVRVCSLGGVAVVPWTVDDASSAAQLRAWGATGVISDRPAAVRVATGYPVGLSARVRAAS